MVLELGAYKGRSTAALARTALRVVSVDWHRGDDVVGGSWTLPEFCATLRALGLWDRVTPVVGRFEEVCPLLAPCFGLVWVDGAHDADSVERDTRLALNLLAPGGVIVWDDWNYPSVREGVGRVLRLDECKPLVGAIATWSRDNG